MTEPDVASSDAKNLETKLTKIVGEGGRVKYVLNGKKWWSTGAMDPRCRVVLVVAKMDYSHPSCSSEREKRQSKRGNQTVLIVPMPHPHTVVVWPRPFSTYRFPTIQNSTLCRNAPHRRVSPYASV